jgi:anti-sigma B factor antagonist
MTMAQHLFEARLRQESGKVIIDLYGEINAFAAADLDEAFTQAEASDCLEVLLNFADVEYINSTGIALIVGLVARANKKQRRLVICCLSEHYQEIFHITRLSEYVTIYPNEAAALAAA